MKNGRVKFKVTGTLKKGGEVVSTVYCATQKQVHAQQSILNQLYGGTIIITETDLTVKESTSGKAE